MKPIHGFAAVATAALLMAVAFSQQLRAQHAVEKSFTRSPDAGTARGGLAAIYEEHETLAARFRSLWTAAAAPKADVHDRVSFLRFLNHDVLDQLEREGTALYPVFDSVTGGSFATTAALFDRGAISGLIHQLGDRDAYRDPGVFRERSYAIATALEGYFTKTEFLVLPAIQDRLSAANLRALIARW